MSVSNGSSAIFLDRDGVIIENRAQYVRDWSDVAFLPGSLEALRLLAYTRHKVVIVTNQSVVGRGLITLVQANEINLRLQEEVERQDGRIDGIYMCPHAPADACDCRKPAPGLIQRASEEHSIDLGRSLLIGDAISDLRAGRAAGIPRVGLVETGRGRKEMVKYGKSENVSFPVFTDLLEATIRSLQISELVEDPRRDCLGG